MSFASTLKAITNKVNSIAKEMDKKVDNFADEVLSIIEDYDNDFFVRSDDGEKDRADMKASIVKLFEMFKEDKPKNINGYILFTKEQREDCGKRNPGMSPTDLTKALSVEWKALEQSERDEYNTRAKSVAPQTDEEKKAKRSASGSAKEQVTCDYNGCDKVVKNPTQHSDGCTYCATHFKKVVSDAKKASTPKCQHEAKDGKKCTSEAINGEWCSRHMKKSSPSNSPSVAPLADKKDKKSEKEEKKAEKQVEKKSEKPVEKKDKKAESSPSPATKGFNFKNTVPVSITENPEWWVCKGIKIEGEKHRLHKETGLVLHSSENNLLGIFIDGKYTELEDLYMEIKAWAKQCGISIKDENEDIELDSELDE